MRGKESDDGQRKTIGRITPAYAGKSSGSRCQPLSNRDHPRLCGEKGISGTLAGTGAGSPPPMRGKGFLPPEPRSSYRITPAYAGKRKTQCLHESGSKDHPRLCGEKRLFSVLLVYHKGSPPPMRGKVPVHDTVFFHAGITPAYAGKS